MALRTASPSTLSSIQSTAGERDTVRAPRIVPDSKAAFGRSQQRKSVQKQGSLDIRLYDQRGSWEEHNPGERERIRIDAWGATMLWTILMLLLILWLLGFSFHVAGS